MSKVQNPSCVIEWSPDECVAWAPGRDAIRRDHSISEIASGLDTSASLLAISRTSCFIRAITIPLASRQDTALLIRNRLSSLFPIPPSDLAYDFASYPLTDHRSQVILIAAMRADILRMALKQAEDSGVKIVATLPAAIAAPLTASEVGLTSAAIVQPVHSGFAIDIVEDGVLRYSRIVGQVDDPTAEIARTFAAAGTESFPIISISGAYERADYFLNHSPFTELSKIDLLHRPLNIELNETKKARESEAINRSTRAASIGLVASLILAGMVTYSWISQINKVKAQTAQLNQDISTLQTHKTKVDDVWKTVSPDEGVISRAYKPAQRLSDVLALISHDSPKGIWFKSFGLDRGKTFILQGTSFTSNSVSTFVQNLSAEQRLRNVQLLFANDGAINKVPIVQFSLTGFPVGNLPLTDPTNQGGS